MKSRINHNILLLLLCQVLLHSSCKHNPHLYTRGVGIYPGSPIEDFSPTLVRDESTYRNIARLRPAWSSASYDYNLTAQLLTDGIIDSKVPSYISVSTNKGEIPRNEREWLLDQNRYTEYAIDGNDVYIQYKLNSESTPAAIDKIIINGTISYNDRKAGGWKFVCSGSDDGLNWTELSKFSGTGLPGREKPNPWAAFMDRPKKTGREQAKRPSAFSFFDGPYGSDSTAPKPSFNFKFSLPGPQRNLDQTFIFNKQAAWHIYRISLSAPCAEKWVLTDLDFVSMGKSVVMVPSTRFTSAWMSSGNKGEWASVDLGSESTFDNIKLHWINKALQGAVEVSDNGTSWKEIATLPGGRSNIDDLHFKEWEKGRYVRVIMDKPAAGNNFILSEIEVYGKGGLVPKPQPNPDVENSRLYLSGGNWKIQRSSLVSVAGDRISRADFRADDWVVATVPGTALISYRNAGALPDPNFGGNMMMISESFFYSDFWYRDEFDVPLSFKGKNMFLNFDGINWKADVFVNGTNTGNIAGAFIRGKFNVTELIKPGEKNVIAVLIHRNDNPGVVKEATASWHDKNGGILGLDNPTYHASIGWDWIPTIRGRNIGIWNDVWLNVTGNVTIEDPFVSAKLPLPDTTSADISIELTLHNNKDSEVSGTLSGSFGNKQFQEEVNLEPGQRKVIRLSPSTHQQLHLKSPQLWWPKGYGNPYLYDVELSFITGKGKVSDVLKFKSGVREMTFNEDNGILNMYINGRRFIGRGGNWGFPESNLAYRGREYDAAVAYHADMNFTMIRNWVGQTADDEFFDACDRHGIMIWQDFCLANPADGPDPSDPKMFIDNAEDVIKRIRNHPSIGIYVGRNEGNPPVVIDTALRNLIARLHPDIHYIPNSAMGVVSGGGPYNALPVRDYFLLYGYNKFHSERGMPNVMTFESLKQTLPDSALWPQNSLWGFHDYTLLSAQACESFNKIIEKGFGPSKDAREFTELAQWINYDGYRGMFEGRSLTRQGLLLWMSHPAWPSMVWQTYDYYLEPTAAYFGCKKASEPIHIQWNPVFDNIEVVNYSAGNRTGLTAEAMILNMDGSVQWEKKVDLNCREDSTAICFRLDFPKNLTPVHFIKLKLTKGADLISDNFYWRGTEEGNFRALRDLPKATLEDHTMISLARDNWLLTTTIKNTSKVPALMIRLKVIEKRTGERVLPVLYTDNYFSLMPGDQKVIISTIKDRDTHGRKPAVVLSGFNLN